MFNTKINIDTVLKKSLAVCFFVNVVYEIQSSCALASSGKPQVGGSVPERSLSWRSRSKLSAVLVSQVLSMFPQEHREDNERGDVRIQCL